MFLASTNTWSFVDFISDDEMYKIAEHIEECGYDFFNLASPQKCTGLSDGGKRKNTSDLDSDKKKKKNN